MYHTHFLRYDLNKITAYKKYSNTLSQLISESFKSQFARDKGNLKSTWKLIGKLRVRPIDPIPE